MIISKGKAQAYPELRGKLENMRYPAYVECKVDGEMDWVMTGAVGFINKSGKIRTDFPALKELQAMLTHPIPRLLGELHWGAGKSGDLYELLKHQNDDKLRFTVFDVDMPGDYSERRGWLERQLIESTHVRLVESWRAGDKKDVDFLYGTFIDEGYEGIVVKSADNRLIMGPCSWVKIKQHESRNCIITAIDPSRERIEVSTGRATVGVKVPTVEKLKLKIGDVVELDHLGELESGALRNPVYKLKG